MRELGDLVVDLSTRGDRAAAVYRALLEAIRGGRLSPGERLPPTRALAADLGVSRTTVATAYDRLVAEGRLGVRIDENPESAREELESWIRVVSEADPFLRDHPPRVTWPGGAFRGGSLAPGHPLRGLVAAAHEDVTGRAIGPERGAPYGSDLRLYAGAGIPTLHYGPGSPREAHGPDESVPIEEVAITAEVLARCLRRAG